MPAMDKSPVQHPMAPPHGLRGYFQTTQGPCPQPLVLHASMMDPPPPPPLWVHPCDFLFWGKGLSLKWAIKMAVCLDECLFRKKCHLQAESK